MTIDLFVMPYKLTQMYWGMSASAVPSYQDTVCAREVPRGSLLLLLLTRPWRSSKRIICIHWATELYGSKYVLKSVALLTLNICALYLLKHFCRCKVVYVVHNNYAHDYPHPYIDKVGQQLLQMLADVFVAQQKQTEQHLRLQYPHKKIVYIPHASFVGAYGPLAQRTNVLRECFGFAPSDIVLLSFGSIRPYKKIEYFIDALAALGSARDPRIKLWIAGRGDTVYIKELRTRAASFAKDFDCVRITEGFVEDSELPAYFAAADYALFYFDDSELTSGSLLLALSYGLPVITRAIAGAEQVTKGESGYTFANMRELKAILASLPPAPPSQSQVVASLQHQEWHHVEEQYLQLYTSSI